MKVRANRLVARVNHNERSRRVAGWVRRAESGGLQTAEGFRAALSGLHCMRWALGADFHPPHLRIRVAKRQARDVCEDLRDSVDFARVWVTRGVVAPQAHH